MTSEPTPMTAVVLPAIPAGFPRQALSQFACEELRVMRGDRQLLGYLPGTDHRIAAVVCDGAAFQEALQALGATKTHTAPVFEADTGTEIGYAMIRRDGIVAWLKGPAQRPVIAWPCRATPAEDAAAWPVHPRLA